MSSFVVAAGGVGWGRGPRGDSLAKVESGATGRTLGDRAELAKAKLIELKLAKAKISIVARIRGIRFIVEFSPIQLGVT